MSKKLRGDMMLLLTALIWGASFVAQRAGMDYIGPFTFNGLRSIIGAIVLIPVIMLLRKPKTQDNQSTESISKSEKKILIVGGVSCGVVLFIASSLQQIGMVYTSAGKAGFITALYIVLVPIFGIFIGKRVRPAIWLCVALAVGGLYLLCVDGKFSISMGDLLVMICAFAFAVHILVIDYFSPKTDGVKMSCIQFLVCGVISIPLMFLFEQPDWGNILACWLPICYAGLLSCGVAYTLQIVAQKNTDPTIASLLLSLESVFAVIAGALILNEQLSAKELIGCVIMFVAIIISQLPSKEERLAARGNQEDTL